MAFPTIFHEDSDADDEYERSVIASPQLPTDSEASPTDSDPPSAEHTPTTYGNFGDERLPKGMVTDWTAEDCAEYISGLGLPQYYDVFLDNSIVGEALIALRHEELKEMGIVSAGHRLTVLKSIYDVKVKQDIAIEPEHYVPLSADVGLRDAIATQEDIARIIQSIKIRDERIIQAEAELKKVTEDYRRLREELLPVFRMAKEISQPLPQIGDTNGEQAHCYDQTAIASPPQQSGNSISRKYSTKTPGTQPKNSSPTHIPLSNQDSKLVDGTLDPSAAVVAASSHLTAFVSGGGSQPSSTPHQPNMPSPTSPQTHSGPSTLPPRTYPRDPSSSRSLLSNADDSTITSNYYPPSSSSTPVERDRGNPTPTSSRTRQDEPPGSAGSAPTVEIFKSFRVSMDDPCYKVLPAALKKYQINADWRQYALYIVYGDQERCLDLQERPLILFKQLDREGKKPMFMLRRHQDGSHAGSAGLSPGSAGLEGGQQASGTIGRSLPYQSGLDLPGGVL
ncbi:hypothetical protein GP486_002041 [Trichoglossum hirsutum]|uniref:Uncharacterized protein n=1 Tax=Trichoglossum hirsutum TaxID=265104 RepID=A0A9P8LFZ4_9PEZI|nr:hypothetical protein GP486_002041 [Trichoglossum hirsutum]